MGEQGDPEAEADACDERRLGPIQPTIAVGANGELIALCRDSGRAPGRVLRSVSTDNGETWSLARDTDLPNPGSSLAVVTLRDGRWALVYNLAAMPLAALGLVHPWLAAAGMSLSSVAVVMNSLRIGARPASSQTPGATVRTPGPARAA